MAIKKDARFVVVRSHLSGVWFGELKSLSGDVVTLKNARKIWSWTGAKCTSNIAVEGCGGNIAPAVEQAVLPGVCEVLFAKLNAAKIISEVKPWH